MHKRFAIGLLAGIVVLSLMVAGRHELLRFAIEKGAGIATGYAISIARVHLDRDEAALARVRVARGDDPLFEARRIAIRFSLRDLLPGSGHRFGLLGVDVIGAKLTLIRFRDGTFDLNLPRGGPLVPGPQRVNPVPLRFSLRVRDARIELREPSAYDPSAKVVRVGRITADGFVDTAAVTRYRVSGTFEEGPGEPFSVAGRIDAVDGYAIHHASAARFPLRALANYFADTPAVRILGGTARNFDARVYALGVAPEVAPGYHVGLRLDVDGGRLALQALAAPVERVRARLEVIDNAFFVRGATAMLAGIPLNMSGGAYDFDGSLTGRAQLRLAVWGRGDLSGLRRAFTFASDQPISGAANLGVLVNGPVDDPVIVARVDAARARYRELPFDSLAASVVYHSNVVALAPLRVGYSGVALGLHGTLELGRHVRSRFAVHLVSSAKRLPYLDEMLGDEPILIDAAATGSDLLFHVAASAASALGSQRVAALVDMNPNGTASVDPFWFHTQRGDFDGGYLLDRPHGSSAFWMLARGLRMRAPPYKTFPGISLPEVPPIDGRTVGMALAGGGAGTSIVLAGRVGGSDASIAAVKFARFDAALGGTMQNVAINRLRATGPWGTFDGHGGFSAQRFAAYGSYRGTFDGLQPLIGNAIAARGPVAGTIGIGIDPHRIVVQGSNLAMHGATLRGVPVDRASLTLAIAGSRLRIFSANARTAGGDLVAAGTLNLAGPSTGSGEGLSLVAKRLSAAQLAGIGLPLRAGTLSATGNLRMGAPLPAFDGGVAVDGGRLANFTLVGNGDVRLSGDAVSLRRMLGALGGTYAHVDGSIGALSSGSPAYALDAYVPAARIARALHSFALPNYMTDGSFNARLHVGGRSVAPSVSGQVGVPAGEVNGLPFVDGSAVLSADPSGVSISRGAVLVGTTATYFTAVARPRENVIDVDAPRADLSDFNNFFDTGDTLDGNGRVKLAASSRGAGITSSGDIDVRGFRYRNLPIGDTKADWSSTRNVIDGALSVGGGEGMLRARGSIGLTPTGSWQSTLTRSRFDLTGDVKDLDLALWMPALGMQGIPITGRAFGSATVRGRFPLIDVRGSAQIAAGTIGPLTLDRAQVAVHTARRRIVIDRAEMSTPELSATAGGTLGLGPDEPLDIQVHATTDRLAQLVYGVSRVRVPVKGSFESTLSIGGTYREPTFLAGFDATGVLAYGVPIASLFGEMRLQRRALVISDAGATFTRGEATLAGSLPLQLAPLRLAAPDQPISFDLDVVGLDPSILDDALGNNTKLAGLIDGHLGLSGTIRQPAIVGRVSLTNGSYVSDLERVPIGQIAAALAFNHSSPRSFASRRGSAAARSRVREGSTFRMGSPETRPSGSRPRRGTPSSTSPPTAAEPSMPRWRSRSLPRRWPSFRATSRSPTHRCRSPLSCVRRSSRGCSRNRRCRSPST